MSFLDNRPERDADSSPRGEAIHAADIAPVTSSDVTPNSLQPVPIVRTSLHPADLRLGLWETLERAWPQVPFHEFSDEELAIQQERVLQAVNGMVTPSLPVSDGAADHIEYELALLREKLLQASLYYTANLLIAIDAAGHTTNEGARRGQWVQFVNYALHVAVRAGGDHMPGVGGARLEAELIEGVLRRLAHEVPDAWALPDAVPDVYQNLRSDFAEAHSAYAKLPARWVDNTTPAAPWLLSKSCAEHLTDGGAEAMGAFSPYIVECAEGIVNGVDADASWARIAVYSSRL